jgi:hypothetical protein
VLTGSGPAVTSFIWWEPRRPRQRKSSSPSRGKKAPPQHLIGTPQVVQVPPKDRIGSVHGAG